VPAIGKESMYGEQLGEEVGGRLERPVHDEVLRVHHAVHVGRGPKEEGTPALHGVSGIPEHEGLPAVGCDVGRRKVEIFQGSGVGRVSASNLSASSSHPREGGDVAADLRSSFEVHPR